jgi:hypothetical protein
MADLFNQGFQDFIEALNNEAVEYILVGGYAVILHGSIRSTADMDVWVNKSIKNYQKLKRAFFVLGAPMFSQDEFIGDEFDGWSIGIEPNRIEVLNKIKGVEFSDAYPFCQTFIQNNIEVNCIHLSQLIKAKEAAGRFKDKADIEELQKRNKTD